VDVVLKRASAAEVAGEHDGEAKTLLADSLTVELFGRRVGSSGPQVVVG